MEKDFYSLDELAVRWNMSVADLLHHAIKGRIKVGVYLYGVCLYGVNSAMRTVGYYSVTGLLTVRLVDPNEFCHPGLTARFGAFFADPAFPPEVSEVSSYTDEASCPHLFFQWAPGHDWDHPEMDLTRIDRYVMGWIADEDGVDTFDLRYYRRDKLVVHPAEVARIDRQFGTPVEELSTGESEIADLQAQGVAEDGKQPKAMAKVVAWKREMLDHFDEIRSQYDGKPNARQVRAWLIDYGSRHVILPRYKQTNPNKLAWRTDEAETKEITIHTIQTVLSKLKREGLFPA